MAINYSTPLKGFSWNPTALSASEHYWLRSDQLTASSGSVTAWTNLAPNGTVTSIGFSGTAPTLLTADLNGRDAVSFPTSTLGTLTSPNSLSLTDPAKPFCLSFVHKGPTLTLGTFYSLVNLINSTAADSMTLYYTNLTGQPNFYLQVGNTTCTIIGCNFTHDQYHYVILLYNGAGSFTTAANYTLIINGVTQTLATTSASGGAATLNQIGDNSGGGAANAGKYTEIFFSPQATCSGGNLVGLKAYYKILYNLG